MALKPSKLFKLRSWLTIDQAAIQLSALLDEAVSKSDIYQFALDKKITISILFPNRTKACIGKIVNYDLIEKEFVRGLDQNTWVEVFKAFPMDGFFDEGEYEFTPSLLLEDEVKTIEGIWDLAMWGGERLDIEHALLQEAGELGSTLVNLNGTFVRNGDVWASLQAEFPQESMKGKYYPAGGIGDLDHVLVIKPTALIDFANLLNDGQKIPKGRPSKLSDDQVLEIKKLHKDQSKLSAEKIAERYGVSDSKIRQVWI